MKQIAVFASGNGSNFEAIVKYTEKEYEVTLLVCDQDDAYVLKRANALGVTSLVFNPKHFIDKNDYEEFIISKLKDNDIEYIALAGYMRIIGPKLLKAYENRIINIHPSLLPSFKGKDAILQAFQFGAKVIGVTIHVIDHEIDSGEIIEQIPFYINKTMTLKEIEREIHHIEHCNYPKVINRFIKEDSL